MKATCGRIVIVLCLVFALLAAGVVAGAAPKRAAKAKPGDCAACHGAEKVLSDGHEATKDMMYDGCLECHGGTGKESLRTKIPSGHIHQLRGITCEKCHGKTKQQEELTMDQCIACHGDTEKLAEKTSAVKPANPHTSPHYGTSLDCNVCHHQHKKSENFCSQCHKFDFAVP